MENPGASGWGREVAHRIAIQGGKGGRIAEFVLQRYGTRRKLTVSRLVNDHGGGSLNRLPTPIHLPNRQNLQNHRANYTVF